MENQEVQGQLQLFFTEQEVNDKIKQATDHVHNTYATSNRIAMKEMRDRAIEWFKSEVRGGSMIDEDALGIYNGLADALGWDTVDSLSLIHI